ncbi:hypothetical protein C1X88_34925, partial [Pseudomonas sp. GP01-A13]
QDQDQKQEHGGLKADLSVKSQIKNQSETDCFSVGAGLPAMQTPRSSRYTEVMPSPASQLLHLNRARFSF